MIIESSLETKMRGAKKNHKALKLQYKETTDSIKKELSDSYYNGEDKFRHAICLYFGEFVRKYSMQDLPNALEISIAMKWNKPEGKESLNYYDVSQRSRDFYSSPNSKKCRVRM